MSVAKIVLIILGSMVASDMVSDPSNMASDAASKVTSDLISDFASNFASNLTSNLASDLTSNEKPDLPSDLSSRWAPFVKICCLLNHVTLLAWNSFKDLFWNKSLGMKKNRLKKAIFFTESYSISFFDFCCLHNSKKEQTTWPFLFLDCDIKKIKIKLGI